jgi:hypothetical protein
VITTSTYSSYTGQSQSLTKFKAGMSMPDDTNGQQRNGSQASALEGSDTLFGAELADTLWTMKDQGLEIDQTAGDTWLGKPPQTKFTDKFLALATMTFAERIRAQYLDDRELTEADLKAMTPEDLEAIEAEIRDAILEAMGINAKQQGEDTELTNAAETTDAMIDGSAANAKNEEAFTSFE